MIPRKYFNLLIIHLLTSPPYCIILYGYMSKPKLEKKQEIPNEIIWELLTPSEVRMLKNRWQIINLLEEGLSIRGIAVQVKVGTDTVVRTARMLDKGSLRKAVDSARNTGLTFKTNTPWIFGKGK